MRLSNWSKDTVKEKSQAWIRLSDPEPQWRFQRNVEKDFSTLLTLYPFLLISLLGVFRVQATGVSQAHLKQQVNLDVALHQ